MNWKRLKRDFKRALWCIAIAVIVGEVAVRIVEHFTGPTGSLYDQVRNDTMKVLPLLTEDCILLWDDYGKNDFLTENESFGVSRFISELRETGVGVLYGTGLAFLRLNEETREKLLQAL